MNPRGEIETALFADEDHPKKIDTLVDLLAEIASHIEFAAMWQMLMGLGLVQLVRTLGVRRTRPRRWCASVVLERVYNLLTEQMEYQLLECMRYKRFGGLATATNIPDRSAVWTFENRVGDCGKKALCKGVTAQVLKMGFISCGCQIINATLVPAPQQQSSWRQRIALEQGALPANRKPVTQRHKYIDSTWREGHGKRPFGYKLFINGRKKYKFICKIETDAANTHDSQHFDKVLDTHNKSLVLYSERGYPSEKCEAWLKENCFLNQIEPKDKPNKPLTECWQRRNELIAKTHARGKHAFAAIERVAGKLNRTTGRAQLHFARMMAACCNLRRFVHPQEVGIQF